MIRVSALAPYPVEGPSTRFRLAQFVTPLASRGIELRIHPFMNSERYLALYGASAVAKGRILLEGWRGRISGIRDRPLPDLWIVHRELAPVGNRRLERALRRTRVPYVFDFDDAIYMPQPGGDPGLRFVRNRRADAIRFVKNARTVLAGNEELARFARQGRDGMGASVEVLPTVIDTHRFRPSVGPRGKGNGSETPVVGWIGTHSTAPYLEPIVPLLRSLTSEIDFRVRIVANQPPPWIGRTGRRFEYVPWSADREVEQTNDLAVGLYPLPDTPWEHGKCGFKAIQYMACGVPVVASRVGVLSEVVPDGVAGVLVGDLAGWREALARLLRDPGLRSTMGSNGRDHVERRYSVASVVDGLAGILRASLEGEAELAPPEEGPGGGVVSPER